MTTVVIAALLIGWAYNRVQSRPRYRCPACGTNQPDGHTRECPWDSHA